MQHGVTEDAERTIVSFEGDVDLESSPRAREVLLASVRRGREVLVDLSGVSYIDSSGVASLVEAFQLARKSSVSFGLVCVNDSARRVLELARLDKVFRIFASLEEARGGRT